MSLSKKLLMTGSDWALCRMLELDAGSDPNFKSRYGSFSPLR
jgi:hypothetical protein